MTRLFPVLFAGLALSCGEPQTPGPDDMLPVGTPTPSTFFVATATDTRFHVADHMLASIEMQISGEPFAQLLGKNLAGYNRFSRITDQYIDQETGETLIDPLSYSLAIESYEYSKQAMNTLSFESGAGLSLMYGPLQNPSNVSGDAAFDLLRDRLTHFAEISSAGGKPGQAFVIVPPPVANPLNYYGWPGYWPAFVEFASFDTAIQPASGATQGCTFEAGYAAAGAGMQYVGTYECGYVTLNLPQRETQVEKVVEPAALGFSLWKQMLWTINYWQALHDSLNNLIVEVDDADLPQVGVVANTVVGRYVDPTDPAGMRLLPGNPGVYLGDIRIEGWQGLTMLDEAHNKAAFLLERMMTSDGVQLGGFANTKEAIDYDYQSPLRWWPAKTSVVESVVSPPPGEAWRAFPQPTSLQIAGGQSRLRDLAGLSGGFATFFALTDAQNKDVGKQASCRATFDGDPFPGDDQLPSGEESPHDRALAIMKIAAVNADRLHFDPTNKVMVDSATVANGMVQRGSVVTTRDAAWAIIGLRTALRSFSSTLTLYSNDTPDTIGGPTRLDGASLRGAPAPLPQRIVQLIRAQADFISNKLMAADGALANSYDLAADARDSSATQIEAQASAIRGLLEAYLATSDEKYRLAATLAYEDLERRFWMKDVRAFRTSVGESDKLVWTPIAFGSLQGALRQYWKLVLRRPGQERAAAELLERVKRLNKLVLNGWDDANGDDRIAFPSECTGAGLQMGERALTGELSADSAKGDGDKDCVKEISVAKHPATLAGEIVLTRRK